MAFLLKVNILPSPQNLNPVLSLRVTNTDLLLQRSPLNTWRDTTGDWRNTVCCTTHSVLDPVSFIGTSFHQLKSVLLLRLVTTHTSFCPGGGAVVLAHVCSHVLPSVLITRTHLNSWHFDRGRCSDGPIAVLTLDWNYKRVTARTHSTWCFPNWPQAPMISLLAC